MGKTVIGLLLLLAAIARSADIYIPNGFKVPAGVSSYKTEDVDDVIARLANVAPKATASYAALPVQAEYSSVLGAGASAASVAVVLTDQDIFGENSELATSFSKIPVVGSDYLSQRTSLPVATYSGLTDLWNKFVNGQDSAKKVETVKDAVSVLKTNCAVAALDYDETDGTVVLGDIAEFDANNEVVAKVLTGLADVCLLVTDADARPAAQIAIIDDIAALLPDELTANQKTAITEIRGAIISLLLRSDLKTSVVTVEKGNAARALREVEKNNNNNEGAANKKWINSDLLPSDPNIAGKQIFIWTGIILVLAVIAVFIIMLGAGVDCEKDTLLSRMNAF